MDNSSEDKNIKQMYKDAVQSLAHLQTDYNTLKAQYEQAMVYVQQVEDLHHANNDLTKENLQLKKSIDELNSRLEISIQNNRELKSKINASKQVSSMDSIYKSIEKEKSALVDQIEKINITLKESKKIIKEKSKENELLTKSINNLLETAKNKYHLQFESLSDFDSYLNSQSPENFRENVNEPIESVENSVYSRNDSRLDELQSLNFAKDERIRALKIKVKKLKQKLQQVASSGSKYQKKCAEFETVIKRFENSESSTNSIRMKYEKQIDQITQLFEGQLKSKNDQISSLQQQVKESKVIVMQQPQTNQFSPSQNSQSVEKINSLTDELCETKARLQSQIHKNKELVININTFRKSNQLLSANISRLESVNDGLKKRFEKSEFHEKELEKDLDDRREEVQNLRIEVEELKTQIHFNESQAKAEKANSTKKSSTIEEMTLAISNYKIELNSLQSLLSKQKKEISGLYTERKNLVILLQRQLQLLKLFETQLIAADSQNKILSKQFNESEKTKSKLIQQQQQQQQQFQAQIQQQQQLMKTESIIPLNFWTSSGFPHDLTKMIIEEVKIDGIPVSNKIQGVLNIILKYYTELVESIITKTKEEKSKNKTEKEVFKNFFKEVLQVLEIDNAEMNDDLPNEVCQNIIHMKQAMNALKEENEHLTNIINSFTEKTNSTNFSEADQKIEKLYKQLHKTKENLKNCTAKNKKMRKIIDEMSSESEKNSKEFNESIQNFQSENDRLKFELNSNQNRLKIVNIENEKLKNDLQTEKDNHEKEIRSTTTLHTQQINDISGKCQKEQQELLLQVEKLQNKVNFLTEKLNSMSRENEQLKKSNLLQKNIRESLNRQISELKNGFLLNNQEMTSKFKEEKEAVHSNYASIISQLKNKNETLRKLLDKVTESLSECETKNRELVAENSRITAEKREASVALESNLSAMKREKQLMDTKVRALQLQNEVKCQNIDDQIDQKVARAKQQIYATVAKAFSKFFDASSLLDDDQFDGIVEAAAEEVKRLEKQEEALRQLLALPMGRSIEDAVAKLLVSTYHQ